MIRALAVASGRTGPFSGSFGADSGGMSIFGDFLDKCAAERTPSRPRRVQRNSYVPYSTGSNSDAKSAFAVRGRWAREGAVFSRSAAC